jgi:hypothetical protein
MERPWIASLLKIVKNVSEAFLSGTYPRRILVAGD